jgi:hypothetical protein
MLRVGWFSNWLSFDYLRDTGVPKNIREIPYLKTLIKAGHKIYWIGTARHPDAENYEGIVNYGGIYNGLPKWDPDRWDETADYVRDMAVNYEKYARRPLPDVDAVFIRILPSFIYENAKIYILLYQYGLRGIPVFARDLELQMIVKFIENPPKYPLKKPFGISGSDKAFTEKDWKIMSKNLHILAPLGPKGLKWIKDRAPHLSFESFMFPYDPNLYPTMTLGPIQRHVTYIGNDTGRRAGFLKYFKGLPQDYVHVFGGQARQVDKVDKGFPSSIKDRLPNISWHEAIPHSSVNSIYNTSASCMNIPRPYFYDVEFISARFLEAVYSGAVLLLPEEFFNAVHWTGSEDLVIHCPLDIKKIVDVIAKDNKQRLRHIVRQRLWLRTFSNPETDITKVLNISGENHAHLRDWSRS